MKNNYSKMTIHRITALADGIFAIAMTLLAITIDLPKKGEQLSQEGLHTFLLQQFEEIFSYLISFLLLAVFWMIHHQQFHFIEHTDRKHVWINMVIFMCITLVPFSTSLAGDFSTDWMAQIYFNVNMFIISCLFYFHWIYATSNKHLVAEHLNDKIIVVEKKRLAIVIFSALLATVLSFFYPRFSSGAYILIPILLASKKLSLEGA